MGPVRALVPTLFLPLALALGACELGLHEYQQATTGGCEPWRTGCPAVVDFTAAAPINPSRADVERTRIVAAAAAAPHRQCDTVTPVCQGRIIGDVLRDEYIMVLADDPNASATAASSETRASTPMAPASVASPDVAKPATRERIVRTQGTRAGDALPVPSAPSH